jgi:hypothetical protein
MAQTRIRKNGAFASAPCDTSGAAVQLVEAPFFLAILVRAGNEEA